MNPSSVSEAHKKAVLSGVQIAHAMHCNPEYFARVRDSDLLDWICDVYKANGLEVSVDELQQGLTYLPEGVEFPPCFEGH